ncbi:LOW QUALITY PROTEIN: hypothetical protein PanWU01x14_214370 [Parasponia andersonii]|uniref:Uncharacterized protein n=1 Tax=Parasponia andersonii TaxID=3476 RepID=A0A2P5BSF2_PARAD|nr:LOW QUALITY PROTEIN: hypothetical protein PanWU01x14_214370 [Parasponia andersonii]
MLFTDSQIFHIKVASYDDLDTMLIKGETYILDYNWRQKVVNGKYDFCKHNTFTHIFLIYFSRRQVKHTLIIHYIYAFSSLFDLVTRVISFESFREINRQQEPKKIEAPKGHISYCKPSSNIKSPCRSTI